jgi:hypothetical protein
MMGGTKIEDSARVIGFHEADVGPAACWSNAGQVLGSQIGSTIGMSLEQLGVWRARAQV